MHQRLKYLESHRIKNLHEYAEEVKLFDVSKNFQCDICN